jgi:hypothetical protein
VPTAAVADNREDRLGDPVCAGSNETGSALVTAAKDGMSRIGKSKFARRESAPVLRPFPEPNRSDNLRVRACGWILRRRRLDGIPRMSAQRIRMAAAILARPVSPGPGWPPNRGYSGSTVRRCRALDCGRDETAIRRFPGSRVDPNTTSSIFAGVGSQGQHRRRHYIGTEPSLRHVYLTAAMFWISTATVWPTPLRRPSRSI